MEREGQEPDSTLAPMAESTPADGTSSGGRSSVPERQTFTCRKQLQKAYVQQAKVQAQKHAAPPGYKVFSRNSEIGGAFGVGVGLYFKVISWLKWMFLLLTFCAVPYFVTINTSVFTDATHKDDHTFGVKMYEPPTIYSFTFAAIVDTAYDNNTLQYMNTEMAGTWRGPMRKGNFLTWISLVDAGAIVLALVFITYMTVQTNKFVARVDASTLEAADYTVIVTRLPADTDAREVGLHFSRFGEVMDVVLVRDMGGVLEACARASRLEQRRILQADQMRLYDSALHQQRMDETEAKLEQVLQEIEGGAAQALGPVKAAFVTFNRESEVEVCLANTRSGWLSALWTPKASRLRGTHALRVRQAHPPEDYIPENIPVRFMGRLGRRLLTRVIVGAMVVICAAIVTYLSTFSIETEADTNWLKALMAEEVGAAVSRLQAPASSSAANATITSTLLALVSATVSAAKASNSTLAAATSSSSSGASVAATTIQGVPYTALNWTAYCAAALPTACAPFFGSSFRASSFNMTYGLHFQWANATDHLIIQRPLLKALTACTSGSDAACEAVAASLGLAACLPCYCMGLSQPAGQYDRGVLRDAEWRTTTNSQCDRYVNVWDVRSNGLRVAVSLVITVLNTSLKVVLEWLLLLEKHWTRSEQERSYALLAFIAQLLNSALVLLLVNAAPAASATRSEVEMRSGALKHLALSGQHSDFTRAWYEEVGLSILVLLMLQCLAPLTTILTDVGWKLMLRCRIRYWTTERAAQDAYNEAYARPDFSLQQRVADAMLVLTVALMFGSGMPLGYLLAACVFWVTSLIERYALARVCSATSRYGKQLPALLIALLPWAALAHCCFGVWQHTYFKVEKAGLLGPKVASLSTVIASGLDGADASVVADGVGSVAGGQVAQASLVVANASLQSARALVTRLVQPNGLPLLVCGIVLLLWMLLRHVLWRLFRSCIERIMCRCCLALFPQAVEPSPMTFEEALSKGQLEGCPTYRLPHHPRYAAVFSGHLHRAIMLRTLGHDRFTRLVSNRGDDPLAPKLLVSRNLVLEADVKDLELQLGGLPSKLSEAATRLASTPVQSMTGKSGRSRKNMSKSSPTHSTSSPAAARTVHIQVLADNPDVPTHVLLLQNSVDLAAEEAGAAAAASQAAADSQSSATAGAAAGVDAGRHSPSRLRISSWFGRTSLSGSDGDRRSGGPRRTTRSESPPATRVRGTRAASPTPHHRAQSPTHRLSVSSVASDRDAQPAAPSPPPVAYRMLPTQPGQSSSTGAGRAGSASQAAPAGAGARQQVGLPPLPPPAAILSSGSAVPTTTSSTISNSQAPVGDAVADAGVAQPVSTGSAMGSPAAAAVPLPAPAHGNYPLVTTAVLSLPPVPGAPRTPRSAGPSSAQLPVPGSPAASGASPAAHATVAAPSSPFSPFMAFPLLPFAAQAPVVLPSAVPSSQGSQLHTVGPATGLHSQEISHSPVHVATWSAPILGPLISIEHVGRPAQAAPSSPPPPSPRQQQQQDAA